MSEPFDYAAANRTAWNQAAPLHRQANFARLLQKFKEPGCNLLDETATGLLKSIGVENTAVAQLQCNNGRELLSIKNLGASRCTGFDISDAFIDQARQLAAAGGIECEFVAGDIYAIPSEYDRQFGILFISVGSLGWMPDLAAYFSVVRRLLSPGGWLFIYEMHPLLDMFEPGSEQPLIPCYSYFLDQPFVDQDGLDYYGHTTYASAPTYWFHHKLADIFNACLAHGLALRSFEEYPHDESNVFKYLERQSVRLPLSYTLLAQLGQG